MGLKTKNGRRTKGGSGLMISYLTLREKRQLLTHLAVEIANGHVDEEMIDLLPSLNSLPNVCTTQSCSGHEDGRDGYISLRMTKRLLRRFELSLPTLLTKPWCLWAELNYELTPTGRLRPRMVIWFQAGHCREALIDIHNTLTRIVSA